MGARDTTKLEFIKQPHVIAIVLFVIFIIVASVLTATRRVKQTAELSTMATIDACNKLVSDENLCKYAAANETSGQHSHIMTITTTEKDSPEVSTTVIELESSSKHKSTGYDGQKEVDSSIVIDDTTYVKDYNDSAWAFYKDSSYTGENLDVKYDFTSETSQDVKEFRENYHFEGMEKCGSLECYKYKITVDESQETYLWFDNQEYMTRKIVSSDYQTTANTVFEYKQVSVSVPSPTKEITEADIQNYTQQEATQ